VAKLYEFDKAFHSEIAKAAHNPILLSILQPLEEIDTACVKRFDKYLTTLENCYKEHYDIYKAIEDKDPEAARQAMIQHARNSKAVLLG
jgi:GntR family transcriptional repressor for pyruvate dehydrogenase complex